MCQEFDLTRHHFLLQACYYTLQYDYSLVTERI